MDMTIEVEIDNKWVELEVPTTTVSTEFGPVQEIDWAWAEAQGPHVVKEIESTLAIWDEMDAADEHTRRQESGYADC